MLTQAQVNEFSSLFAEELKLGQETRSERKNKNWSCPISTIELGDYLVEPLTKPKQVKSEGYLMKNCIRDYISECQQGRYLIFSVRLTNGERIATLGVKKNADYWVYDDCLGKENNPVIEETYDYCDDYGNCLFFIDYTEIFSVAHEVIRLLNSKEKN